MMMEFLNRGGWVMYVILFCSIASLGIILERFWFYFSTRIDYDRFIDEIKVIRERRPGSEMKEYFVSGKSSLHVLAGVIMDSIEVPREEREELLHKTGSRQVQHMERGLAILSAIGQLAPLLGLLGTVLGMITCFRDISNLGGHADAAVLAGGIWEALLTTAFGLTVAIPVIGVHHYFESLISRRSDEMQYLVAELNVMIHGDVQTNEN
ncbi:MAG: biopolymer transporter [Spirochaetae bacterium HGW-Spirochaetae-1]|jgi:biopolymer transport protein ExbB|nr:MAG: biopolymer transporter [Spirochaetae bacterium HGW-Spirochaetae-1]